MGENTEERGILNTGQWTTIYAGATPHTFFTQLFGSITSKAKLNVEIDNKVEGVLTQKNPKMHANGNKIRLYNAGTEAQQYNYYPV